MRFLIVVKANQDSENGVMPDPQLFVDMGKYNEELVKAGVMQAAEGLRPSSFGKRVRFDGSKRTIVDGPFAETKELIAGYWIFKTQSMEEAVDWVKRAPFDGGAEIEIRPIFEMDDLAKEVPSFTPELHEQESRFRAEMDKQK